MARRLDTVEARLVALGAQLEQLEASLHQVIRDEGHTVSTEIRYTLSELGRRLALDLPQTLDRHRQMIVAELRPAGPGEGAADVTAPVDAPAEAAPDAGAVDSKADDVSTGKAGDSITETDGDSDGTADAEGDASTESSNDGGRRKRRRRRGEG